MLLVGVVGFAVGRLIGYTLLALWWLLRALWAVLWRVLVLTAALAAVAFSRALAWRLLTLALSAAFAGTVVRHLGGRGVSGLSGQRRTTSTGLTGNVSTAPPVVKLKPVSAQQVATASYKATRFFTQALDGPGLLSMLVGPAGVGKSEVVWGSLRAGYDGQDFCGLKTTKPKRVLLLSEMGGETLAPALRRWGLYAEPRGKLDALRLRFVANHHAGGLIDVLYATDVYRPVVVDGELRLTEWPAVVEAVRGLVARGRYDRVIIDSLGEWMGGDNNDQMLKTLGACRQLTAAGVGVLILHHTPRTDPKRPRGGTVIEAKLDTGCYVVGTASGGAARSRQDPVRELGWFKTRFPDLTPPGALRIERVLNNLSAPAVPIIGTAGRPRYQLEGAVAIATAGAGSPGSAGRIAVANETAGTLTANEAKVLAAMQTAGRLGATTKQLAAAAGIPRQRAHEAVLALIRAHQAREGGYQETPGGGPKASLYVALATTSDKDFSEVKRPALRLVETVDHVNGFPEPGEVA